MVKRRGKEKSKKGDSTSFQKRNVNLISGGGEEEFSQTSQGGHVTTSGLNQVQQWVLFT